MSCCVFGKELDEYSDDELHEELARRADCEKRGVCSYCGMNGNATKCRFPSRHPSRIRKKKIK